MSRHGAALAAAERRYGVDRYAIAAVWGVESDYGQLAGKWYLPQALATLACTAPRRRDYFRGELLATLQIVADAATSRPRSCAARGPAQSDRPSSCRRPTSASASTATATGAATWSLRPPTPCTRPPTSSPGPAGWRARAWGYEVDRARAATHGPSGRTAQGVAGRVERRSASAASTAPRRRAPGPAGLLLPAGATGPAFLVFKNYDAVYSYNAADSYALAIALLSDRLRGKERRPRAMAHDRPWPVTGRAQGGAGAAARAAATTSARPTARSARARARRSPVPGDGSA